MTAALPDWNSAVQPAESQNPTLIKTVLLPIDRSDKSQFVLAVARTLAELYHATIHYTFLGVNSAIRKQPSSNQPLGSGQFSGAVFESISNDAANEILRLSRELPDALPLMSTAMGPQTRSDRFGSITESILAQNPRIAVLVNPGPETSWKLRRILLAHDGTPVSNPAISPAADLAQRARAEVIALHVAARGEERPEARGSMAAPLYVDQPQHEWPAWAEEFMNRVVASGAVSSGVHFKLRVTGGQAGSELADVARQSQADLVIMAWHGHWSEHGECASRVVVRNAGCPVMLVYSES